MLLEDSRGHKSLTATMSIVAFVIIMLKFIVSGAEIAVGSFTYEFGAIDSLSIAAILGPILGTYAWRRHTEATYPEPGDPVIGVDETMIVEERGR